MYRYFKRSIGAVAAAVVLFGGVPAAAQQDAHPPLPPPDPDVYLDRSGFNELLINQAIFGLQIGSALTTALFEDQARQASGSLLGLGAGIALPIVLTRDRPVPSGDVVYINQLQRLGLINGILVASLFDDPDLRTVQGLIAGGSLLGLGASLLTKDILELSPGQASALGAAYNFSLFTGAMLMLILDVAESPREVTASLLAFSNTGLALGFIFRDALDVNRSRVIWTGVGGAIGAGVGAGFGWLVGGAEVSAELMQTSALVGFWAGAITTFLYLVPPESYHQRAELSTGSLLEVGEEGSLKVGLPVPRPMMVPARQAGGGEEIIPSLSLVEWRSR